MNSSDTVYKLSVQKILLDHMKKDYPYIYKLWNSEEGKRDKEVCFLALQNFIDSEAQVSGEELTDEKVLEWFSMNESITLYFIDTLISRIYPEIARDNVDIIENISKSDLTNLNRNDLYQAVREVISKNEFKIDENKEVAVSEIKTDTEEFKASLIPGLLDKTMSLTEEREWKSLAAESFQSMDDQTADILDIICVLWQLKPKKFGDVVSFHCDDALDIKGIKPKRGNNAKESIGRFRGEQRREIMKRVVTLASIWISSADKNEVMMYKQDDEDDENYILEDLEKLISIDKITLAKDEKTKEVLGIIACDVRPSEQFAKPLSQSPEGMALLHMKAIQYNHRTHFKHKRLTRFFSWNWLFKNESDEIKDEIYQIGGEKGLLNVTYKKEEIENLKERKPNVIKERLESTLDDLTSDEVIGGYEYVEIDESKIGKKGWIAYWESLFIRIFPPDDILGRGNRIKDEGNRGFLTKKLNEYIDNVIDPTVIEKMNKREERREVEGVAETLEGEYVTIEKEVIEEDDPVKVSEEIRERVGKLIEGRGITFRSISEESGVSKSALHKFIKRSSKTLRKDNEKKILLWLEKKES